jgi:F-type H+-transporting ATPase subunit epsilon
MATFPFELVSPERLLFAGEVEDVVVPGVEGDMTVLKDHAPLMTTLRPGVVNIGEVGGKRTRLYVRGGFADVSPVGLTILAEASTPIEEFDAAKLEIELQDAQESLAAAQSEESRQLAAERVDQLKALQMAPLV